MSYAGSNNLSLKYQRFTPSDCKEIVHVKFELVAMTSFLSCPSKENVKNKEMVSGKKVLTLILYLNMVLFAL